MESLKLIEKYNDIYQDGKENFHTFPLDDIYQEVFSFIQLYIKGKSVLELGSGDGTFVLDYLSKEAKEIFAIDFSSIGIEKSRKRMLKENKDNCEFIECDLNNIDDKLSIHLDFDAIVSIGVIEHLDDPSIIFKIARDRLLPNGYLFLNHPHFLNLRGLVWKALEIFCNAKMSLTDKHTILPDYIFSLAENYGFKIETVKTIRQSVGMGKDMLKDYNKRLRKAMIYLPDIDKKVDEFLNFLDLTANPKIMTGTVLSGSEIIWRFKKI